MTFFLGNQEILDPPPFKNPGHAPEKHQADPVIPKNYRPVLLVEMSVLDQCSHLEFANLQLGFTEGRGTVMAAALAEGVTNYCVTRGSPIFLCSIDADGALDGFPPLATSSKNIDVIADVYWRLIYFWYLKQNVVIRWDKMSLIDGTRW